eukprot:scaffold29574_cov90-Isochrysis_galbana.AAC.1
MGLRKRNCLSCARPQDCIHPWPVIARAPSRLDEAVTNADGRMTPTRHSQTLSQALQGPSHLERVRVEEVDVVEAVAGLEVERAQVGCPECEGVERVRAVQVNHLEVIGGEGEL